MKATTWELKENHDYKNHIRPRLWKGMKKIKKYASLPSPDCGDIISGLEHGVITKNTEIVAWEKGDADAVRRKLKSLGIKKFVVHKGRIDTLRAAKILLESWEEKPFDMIYLDFCGELTYQMKEWMSAVAPVLNDTVVAATFCISFRNNQLAEEWESGFDNWKIYKTEDPRLTVRSFGFDYAGSLNAFEKANWTTQMMFDEILGRERINGRTPNEFIVYREEGLGSAPMLFLVFNKGKKNIYQGPKEVSKPSNYGLDEFRLTSTFLRSLSEERLWALYNAYTSPGKKAIIRRVINSKKEVSV